MKEELLSRLAVITEEESRILNGDRNIDRSIYNLEQSSIVDCKGLLREGRLIDLRPHTRFVHFPRHSHNYVELVYMCQGQTEHIIDNSSLVLKQGELLLLSQNAIQEIKPAGLEDIAVNLIILPEFFDKPLDMISGEVSLLHDFLIGCLISKKQNSSYLHFRVSDVLPIQNLIENIIWTLLQDKDELENTAYDEAAESSVPASLSPYSPKSKRQLESTTMGLLLLHLISYTDRLRLGEERRDEEVLFQVLQYIEEHYQDAELSGLAGRLGYSLYRLSRIIKAQSGKNFTELVQEKRLMKSAFLLRSTELSITDISLEAGYHNFSYFYRIFRKRFGCSPRSYRLRFS